MTRSGQDHCKDLAGFFERCCQDLAKILQGLAGFKQDHCRVMTRSWYDLAKILQGLAGFRQDHCRVMTRSWYDLARTSWI